MNVSFHPGRDMDGNTFTQIQFLNADGLPDDVEPAILVLQSDDPKVTAFEQGLPGNDVVLSVGQALFDNLNQHPNCVAAFNQVLGASAGSREVRLKFSNKLPEAKHLPWEALVANNASFLSIDNNVPILREVRECRSISAGTLAANEPLRFLAVIGAEGNDGQGEWHSLLEAIKNAKPDLRLEILLLASNRNLVDAAGGLGIPRLTAEPLPISGDDLTSRIARFAPHVAHFFAHGFAGPPTGLAIETANAAHGAEPIMLSASDLDEALSAKAWVVVLNACSLSGLVDAPIGYASTASLCEELVGNGIPVVIGMRGEVDSNRAHRFSRGFHRRLLRELAQLRMAGQGTLQLGPCFTRACRAILDADGGNPSLVARNLNAWAFPIMNVHRDQFVVEVLGEATDGLVVETEGSTRQEILGELDTLRALLRDMGDRMPTAARGSIEARIQQLLTIFTA